MMAYLFFFHMVHWSFILGQGWLLSNHFCKACKNCLHPSFVIVHTAVRMHYFFYMFTISNLFTICQCPYRDVYDLGRSFFPLKRAQRETLVTLTTLNRTPGMSPTAWPLRPNPATSTSSFSSMKLRQPSLGTKAVIFFPFLMSCTLTHLRMAELGCLASTPTFSRTIPLAWEAPPNGLALRAVLEWAFL